MDLESDSLDEHPTQSDDQNIKVLETLIFVLSIFIPPTHSLQYMVSADYLKYHLSQSIHISHVGWS